MQKIETTVGYRIECDNGEVRYYPDTTANGQCYKDDKAFKNGTGVAYIREAEFDEAREDEEGNYYLTREDLVSDIYTRNDMHHWASKYFRPCDLPPRIRRGAFINHAVECVYYELDWQGFDMLLDECDWLDDMDEYTEKDN